MIVQLAYPYEGNEPDELVELDDAVARGLISDGWARVPDADELNERTVDELKAYAAEQEIDLAGATRKAQIVTAIRAAEQTRATNSPPAPGDNPEEVS